MVRCWKSLTTAKLSRYVLVRLPVTSNSTTGYTNYWIQLLARKLSLEQIWIVEDQVKSIYKTVPNQQLPIKLSGSISIEDNTNYKTIKSSKPYLFQTIDGCTIKYKYLNVL